MYHVLPEELWNGGYLDGPMEDVFNPGHAYRYVAVGWGFVNDSPATIPLLVPDTFPRPGGAIRAYRDPLASPVRCLIWSVGPKGPIRDFVALQAFVPADPAGWHPATPGGIVCSYLAGGAWASSP